MNRRAFLTTIAAIWSGWCARLSARLTTTTLSAAPLDSPTIVSCYPEVITPDTPFLILTKEITLEEFTRQYPSEAARLVPGDRS